MAARAKGGHRCPRCQRVKPATEFYDNPTKHSGVSHYCKRCVKEMAKERRRRRGLKEPGRSKVWTRERTIEAIQRWHRKRGETPSMLDWAHNGPDHPTHSTVARTFGSWNNAIEAAGFEPRPKGHNR